MYKDKKLRISLGNNPRSADRDSGYHLSKNACHIFDIFSYWMLLLKVNPC